MKKILMSFYQQLHSKDGFFLPTIGIYIIVTLSFILIQTINVLSLQYNIKVQENLLYEEAAFAHVNYKINKHKDSIIDSFICFGAKEDVLHKTYNGVKVDVTSQCHKVPKPYEPDELSAIYDEIIFLVKHSDVKVSPAVYTSIKAELDIVNDLEVVEDGEDFIEIIASGGTAIIKVGIEELEEMTFEDWIVYEVSIKDDSKHYKMLVFYHRNKRKVKKVIYTV